MKHLQINTSPIGAQEYNLGEKVGEDIYIYEKRIPIDLVVIYREPPHSNSDLDSNCYRLYTGNYVNIKSISLGHRSGGSFRSVSFNLKDNYYLWGGDTLPLSNDDKLYYDSINLVRIHVDNNNNNYFIKDDNGNWKWGPGLFQDLRLTNGYSTFNLTPYEDNFSVYLRYGGYHIGDSSPILNYGWALIIQKNS